MNAERPTENVVTLKKAYFVFYCCITDSQDPKDWTPVLPQHVPDEFKGPNVIGKMLREGLIVKSADGLLWYRIEKVPGAEPVEEPDAAHH